MSSLIRTSSTLCFTASALLALAACDPGTGNLTENTDSVSSTSGGESDGATSSTVTTDATGATSSTVTSGATSSTVTTDATGATSSTVTTDATGATSSTVTTDATTATSSTGTTGEPAVCDNPNFTCEQYELDCELHNCGELDSHFDADGCLRTPCSDASDCGDAELCYAAYLYGGCVGSEVFCEDYDEDMSCSCGGSDDCNGAFCVPAELVPGELQLGPGTFTDGCAPNDAPAYDIEFGLESATCDAPWSMDQLRVRINLVADQLPPGDYSVTADDGWGQIDLWGDNGWQQITEGVVTIVSWEGDVITGAVELHADGLPTVVGSFSAAYCAENPMCG